jgi:hypothetical protein
VVLMPTLLTANAGQCQYSATGVDDDGLGLRMWATDEDCNVVVAETGVAVNR